MKCCCKMFLYAMLVSAVVFLSGLTVQYASAVPQQPESSAQAEEQESSPEYIEQYEAWETADKEPDLLKRGALLAEFIGKYPKSELMPNVKASFRNAMIECDNSGKYQELETLAEQWLKLYPEDLDGLAFLVKAAEKLGHNDKWIQGLLEIYKQRTTGAVALEIARTYKKMNNTAKYIEWSETALKYPEFDTDFTTRLNLMQYYVDQKNYPKAIEYSRSTIQASDLVKDPSADTKAAIIKVKHFCYEAIGKIELEQDKLDDAIKSFRQAYKMQKSDEDLYLIALCLDKQNNVDDAMVAYARAELQGGDFASKSKERLEQIYKALHNNTLVGIDKIYRKAKEPTE